MLGFLGIDNNQGTLVFKKKKKESQKQELEMEVGGK